MRHISGTDSATPSRPRRLANRLRPRIERLEDRAVPSTFTVLNANDAGPDSLRDAIVRANTLPGPDTIAFAPAVTGTITLSTALPDLSTDITIAGPGSSALTVARSAAGGTPEFRIFTVKAGAQVTLSGLTITGGRLQDGGGISNAGTLTVISSTVSENSATGHWEYYWIPFRASSYSFYVPGQGGGIVNSGALAIVNSTIGGNSAGSGRGGGIHNSGSLAVSNCTLSGNQADQGGGINSSGTLTVTNCTLYANFASKGGGIDLNGSSSRAKVTDSLVSGSTGGNLVAEADANFLSMGHNLFSDTPTVSLDPTDLVNTDPQIVPLGDNGGTTRTCALLPGSPAIDAGVFVTGVTTDQRGVPRPQGNAPDIGAFELRVFSSYDSKIAAQGLAVRAPAGTWFTLAVDSFHLVNLPPGDAAPAASSFRAWVNWGDGSFSPGTVKLAADGSYQVVASHRYKKAGCYRTTSQILAWPPGLVLAEVRGKVVAGGRAICRAPRR